MYVQLLKERASIYITLSLHNPIFNFSNSISCVIILKVASIDLEDDDEPRHKFPPNVTSVLESEHLHRKQLKVDTTRLINTLRIQPITKSCLEIPLCRMIVMDEVRLVGEMDVQRLESEFMNGYRDGDRVLYVSLYNNFEKTMDVTEEEIARWSPHWQRVNEEFEKELMADVDLAQLRGKMFYVWDGNHRVSAWMRHITNCHDGELGWHKRVHCIILDPRGQVANLLNAMSDVNW